MTNPIRFVENLWIPLPDGRRLAAAAWLPGAKPQGPAPTILEYLPYRKRDGTAPRDATTHPVFAREGYACIRVDIAGTGDSDGVFDDEYSERELSDGEAVLAWIAAQDWCDGNIGMIGISWGGFNGLQLAFRRPPALKSIVTVCSTVDRYADDIHYMGGALLTDNFNWSGQMHAYQTRPPDPALRDDWRERWLERIETLPFCAADWLRHPTRDAFWKHGSVCEAWSAIEAATLAIGGWTDAYINAPAALTANLNAPVKALMGPWEHKYPHIARTNPADFHGEVLRWFDRWLKGIDNGAEALPDYRAYMLDYDPPSANYRNRPGRWVAEAGWPSPNVKPLTLHMNDGVLSERASNGTRTISSPQTVGAASAYFCVGMRIENELATDQAIDDAHSACFDTAPLPEDMELLGRAEAVLSFSVDKPVAQVCLRLCDVAPDGKSVRISYRPFNLTHHAGHETPVPLEPGKRYTASIALNECGYRVAAGHRLRFAISTGYWPVIWPSPEAATVTLHEDCTLTLPVRVVAAEIDAQSPAPPRDYPTRDAKILRKPDSHTDRRVEPDGTLVLETFDDFGKAEDLTHGMIDGSTVSQRFAIHPDDPLSADHWSQWEFTFERPGWSTRIVTENRMTATASHFTLWRKTTAYEGERVVAERELSEEMPRGLH